MHKDFTNGFILNALNLPLITDLDSLSSNLGLSKKIIFHLSQLSVHYYNRVFIPKRNGTKREILIPSYPLKLIQKWILVEILEKINISNEAMAFKKGTERGIKKNAEAHKYSLYILQLDLENFFTNINRKRVFYIFKNLGYNNFISNILANLCTYNDYLPQGGVTSPYLSNLVCRKMDKRLKGLCGKMDVLYTRYADDLTFSCDNKNTLRKIRKKIEYIIEDEGFKVNRNKTRYSSPGSKKIVTGININDKKVKVNKYLKKTIRTLIQKSIITGDYGRNNEIRGYIAHVDYVRRVIKIK